MPWKRRVKVKNAKKSTYKGKNFQSNLELYCYKELEKAKVPVEYEEQTFTIFNGMFINIRWIKSFM